MIVMRVTTRSTPVILCGCGLTFGNPSNPLSFSSVSPASKGARLILSADVRKRTNVHARANSLRSEFAEHGRTEQHQMDSILQG